MLADKDDQREHDEAVDREEDGKAFDRKMRMRVLEGGDEAGAREAGYVLLRLPLEVAPIFREWLMANYTEAYQQLGWLPEQFHLALQWVRPPAPSHAAARMLRLACCHD
ncbi:MAG: hypothetical protein HC850_16825 [Rhodomicrobium sp.]|nr:hypothetical protein [Rhodomicrobium sp.]